MTDKTLGKDIKVVAEMNWALVLGKMVQITLTTSNLNAVDLAHYSGDNFQVTFSRIATEEEGDAKEA